MSHDKQLLILLHAPTPAARPRQRSHAANLARSGLKPAVHIVVNAEAVAAALDDPDPVHDRVTLVCQNTLHKIGRTAGDPLTVLSEGAVLALARMQGEGWAYVRA
jgi:intracellular sulfur oxidation DsrE/DsrF family protein